MLFRRLSGWPSSGWESPLDELERMRRQMDQFAEKFLGGLPGQEFAGVFPLINLTEDKNNLYLRAELPGLKPEQLDISVTENTFSIAGERKIEPQSEKVQYHRREREAGKFSRIINLPMPIDTKKVEAHSSSGILMVTLPKSEVAKPRQITIKAS
jgi:HSP20 family protein